MKTENVKISQIHVNEANPRTITKERFKKLVCSILVLPKMLEIRPIVVDDTMTTLGGNMRLRALIEIQSMTAEELSSTLDGSRDYQKKTDVEKSRLRDYWLSWQKNPRTPVIRASELSEDERREFVIKDNIGYGDWDMDILANEWDTEDLTDWGLDDLPWTDNTEGAKADDTAHENSLFDRFVVPPFSVLDTRKGYWNDRKKRWYSLIGDFGESRNDIGYESLELKYKDIYTRTQEHRKSLGLSFKEYLEKYVPQEEIEREKGKKLARGVSILDPVMAEIVVRWFGLKDGQAFDCFAGDSVFGFVSTSLGNSFTGIELRQEQAELNNERTADMNARYICDDGQNVAKYIEAESQDLFFSCPPYFDLEVYSDLPNDASNQDSYEDFLNILKNAFTASVSCLRKNRFAVVCVGDVRDKKTGFYYDFVGDVKNIFKQAGMRLYNEIILIEQTASTALRAARYMENRKVAKTHQHLLVFYKGDPKRIKAEFPKIEYTEEDMKMFEVNEEEQK
ncbi:MAG: ParB/RepB/Spo0J family partition protein [Clostridia bacterium]|nr:ParB/RepB/Spo0J family partition protein [Clostridia bacterium]